MDQREALVEAAITCLQERGYARTTTRDIVAAAGSHLPAVNYYFGSKDALLGQAITEALRRWMETTMAVARDPAPATAAERLRRSVDRFLGSLETDRAYVVAALEAFAQAPRSEELRRRLAAEYRAARAQVVASAQATSDEVDGVEGLDHGELSGVATVLLALFDGLAIQWLLAPEETPSADRVLHSLSLLAATLTGDARAP